MYSIAHIFEILENKHFANQKMLEWPIGHHYLIYVKIKITEDNQ